MNYLLANDEADAGVIPNSEDLDVEEDDGSTPNRRSWKSKSEWKLSYKSNEK